MSEDIVPALAYTAELARAASINCRPKAGIWALRHNRVMTSAHPRITIEADKRDGRPCIRGMRITVNDVLGWLAHGMTEEEILEEHPGLEKEDFAAVYAFAADVADTAYGGR